MANMPSVDRTYASLKVSNAAFIALAKVAQKRGTNHTDVAREIIEREMEHIVRMFTDEDKAAVAALKDLHVRQRREYVARVARENKARAEKKGGAR